MRLLICWAEISGYMAACWRAMASMPEVELQIIAFEPTKASFANDLVQGLNCQLLTADQRNDADYVRSLIIRSKPDILCVSGWFHPPYRNAIYDREMNSVSKWIGTDTPWSGTLRQQVGRFALRSLRGHMRRLDRVFVAGERAWQYMHCRAGVPDYKKVCRGLYGIDYDAFSSLHDQRRQQDACGWPRRFLFTGRYIPETKGLDILVDAYAAYRTYRERH